MATTTVGNCVRVFLPPCFCASLNGISPPPKSPDPSRISLMLCAVPSGKYLTCTPGCCLPYCSVHAEYNGPARFDPEPTSESASWATSGLATITIQAATCNKIGVFRTNDIEFSASQLF